jgi:nitroreductase
MADNYKAWEIDYKDFYKQKTEADRINFLLKFAILAPSSHNSQPWKVSVAKNEVRLSADFKRALSQGDKTNRLLFISLGCFLENFLIAAEYYDSNVSFSFFPRNLNKKRGVVTKIVFKSRAKKRRRRRKDHLIFSIPKRVTNRGEYGTGLPSTKFLRKIMGYGGKLGRLDLVKDKKTREKITNFIIWPGVLGMGDRDFREELSLYVKHNLTSSKVGMPAFGMSIPTPVSFIVPTLIKYLNMNKITQKKDEDLLKKHTPVFGLISTRSDDEANWVKAGQLYQKVALECTNCGLSTHVMASPIQIGNFYKDLKRLFATPYRPEVFFRMGYALKEVHHSPRLQVEDILET